MKPVSVPLILPIEQGGVLFKALDEMNMKHTPPLTCEQATSAPAGAWAAPMHRRTVLLGMTASALSLGLASLAVPGLSFAAQAPGLNASRFLQASQVLTGYDNLDALTAQRISAAMIAQQPAMAAQLTALADLVQVPANVFNAEALLAAAKQAGFGDAALAVVAAWFKGTVGHGQTAQLVAYKEALMYRPVSDGLIVPTYCGNGPLWWTAPIPDASAPAAGPRTAV
jgi:hypothetical protein